MKNKLKMLKTEFIISRTGLNKYKKDDIYKVSFFSFTHLYILS